MNALWEERKSESEAHAKHHASIPMGFEISRTSGTFRRLIVKRRINKLIIANNHSLTTICTCVNTAVLSVTRGKIQR